MKCRLVVALLSVSFLAPVVLGSSPTFSVTMVDAARAGREVVIALTSSDVIWAAGTGRYGSTTDTGNLYYENGSTFSLSDPIPPTTGAGDATVFYGLDGYLYWAVLSKNPGNNTPVLQVAARTPSTAWNSAATKTLGYYDRPWFAASPTYTYLVATAKTANNDFTHIDVWRTSDHGVTWTALPRIHVADYVAGSRNFNRGRTRPCL